MGRAWCFESLTAFPSDNAVGFETRLNCDCDVRTRMMRRWTCPPSQFVRVCTLLTTPHSFVRPPSLFLARSLALSLSLHPSSSFGLRPPAQDVKKLVESVGNDLKIKVDALKQRLDEGVAPAQALKALVYASGLIVDHVVFSNF